MAGLSTNAPGLWGGFAGLLYGSTSLSTPPGFLADATPAWVLPGAALDLDFADSLGYNSRNLATTTPDSILTYTSPSPKMVYGSDGVLRYAPHNFFVRSEDFSNASWVNGYISSGTRVNGSVSVSANGGYVYVRQDFSALNKACVASYEVTCDTTVANVPIVFSDGSVNYPVVTSFVAGVPQRITSPAFTPGSFASVGIDLRDFVAPGGSNTTGYTITFNKAQLQLTPNHSNTYIPTTSAAVYSLPIDHDPITFDPLGVLIEEQRTNLLLRSQEFDRAAWIKSFGGTGSTVVVTANYGTAPDGTMTADRVQLDKGAGATLSDQSLIQQTIPSGVPVANSYWIKTADGSTKTVALRVNNTYTLCVITGDWQRFFTTEPTCSFAQIILRGTTGTSDSADLLVWGAQLEAGSFPTSYIPTVASQVTRAADQISILTSAFGYNAVAGSLFAEVRAANLSVSRRIAVLYNDASNRIALNLDNGSQLFVRTLGSTVASVDGGTFTVGQSDKVAVAFTTDDYVATVNGAAVGVDPDGGAMPSGITVLQVGNQAGIEQTNGHIKRLTYFPTRRTDADLQVLTTGDDLVWGIGDYLVWGSGNNLTW